MVVDLEVADAVAAELAAQGSVSFASAKLAAARQLGVPVLMVQRPVLPARTEVHEVAAVLAWLGHGATLGVARGV